MSEINQSGLCAKNNTTLFAQMCQIKGRGRCACLAEVPHSHEAEAFLTHNAQGQEDEED